MSIAPLAVSFYSVVVSLHVIFVIIGIGSAFALPFVGAVAQRNPGSIGFALDLNLTLLTKWISPMAVLVLVTGIYQMVDGGFSFSEDHWLSLSFLLFIIYMGILGAITIPTTRQALELSREQGDGPPSAELLSLIQRNAKIGPLLGFIIVFTTFLMEAKPF